MIGFVSADTLITQDEFLTKADRQGDEAAKKVYSTLAALYMEGKLSAADA